MPTNHQFHPTIFEETPIGGSTSFGAESFVPNITDSGAPEMPTGVTRYTATIQKLGRIVFFHIVLEGVSINFTLGNVFYPPIAPSRFPTGHALAGELVGIGMAYETVAGPVYQDPTTGFFPVPTTPKVGPWRMSGYYWVD